MSLTSLSLAYTAGTLAALTPCALPMLPAYITLNLDSGKDRRVSTALVHGFSTVAGFLTAFTLTSTLPSYIINQVAGQVTFVTPLMGVVLVLLGLGYWFTGFSDRLPFISLVAVDGRGVKGFYFYGVGYGFASMVCSFPVYVLMVIESGLVGDLLSVLLLFVAYGLGVASVVVSLSVAVYFGMERVYHWFRGIHPHMKMINGVILVLSGLYMIITWLKW